ncbi:MAG: hypothetical protein QF464_05495, partial [Myxococcota bacterium]|nr:hypothetical protein [Myxococcota bacterium]
MRAYQPHAKRHLIVLLTALLLLPAGISTAGDGGSAGVAPHRQGPGQWHLAHPGADSRAHRSVRRAERARLRAERRAEYERRRAERSPVRVVAERASHRSVRRAERARLRAERRAEHMTRKLRRLERKRTRHGRSTLTVGFKGLMGVQVDLPGLALNLSIPDIYIGTTGPG